MTKTLISLKKFDYTLVAFLIPVLGLSLTALYSIGLSKEPPDFLYLRKQILFFAIGVVLMFSAAYIDYRWSKSMVKLFYIVGLMLLLGVLLFGRTIRGTTGWFSFGLFQFQPIELVKIFLIMTLSFFYSTATRPINSSRNIIRSFLIVAPLFVLTLLQPDLGSAMMLIILWLGYLFLVGISWRQWLFLAVIGIVAAGVSWFFVLEEYQKIRILVFFDPEVDPLGRAYAIRQSIIAIGSGGWLGRGLGLGSQSQLKFLPESHTDFIFAVIAEELGFMGVMLLLIFTVLFLLRLIQISHNLKDEFAVLVIMGTVILLATQMFLNIAVTLSLMPVTGLPFPFLSSGGSSLLVSFLLLGFVQSIFARHTK